MKPAATIAAFKFSASAKSAAALRNSKKKAHPTSRSCKAVRRPIALNGDAVGRQPDAKPQAMFLIADPAADRLESFLAPGIRYPRD